MTYVVTRCFGAWPPKTVMPTWRPAKQDVEAAVLMWTSHGSQDRPVKVKTTTTSLARPRQQSCLKPSCLFSASLVQVRVSVIVDVALLEIAFSLTNNYWNCNTE